MSRRSDTLDVPKAMTDTILQVQNLSTVFAAESGLIRAVNDVSFEIPRGKAVGLVGESGSGKSTVALSIMRLLGPGGVIENGTIMFQDQDLLQLSEAALRRLRANKIAIVFQDPLSALTPSLIIGEQIAETILFHRHVSRHAAWERAIELLGLVGVPDAHLRVNQYPHQFSGGMLQRVCIAIALSCDPELVILDEPTTALDVTIQAQVLELLDRLREEFNLSMLFISHDLGVIAQICDHVCVLYGGRLVEQTTIKDLFTSPAHPYTKGLLACLPDLTASSESEPLPFISGRIHDLVNPPPGCTFHPRCPFVEARCCEERQVLLSVGDGRTVACWKYERLLDQEWPKQESTVRTGSAAAATSILKTVDVVKDYKLTGFWDSLKIERTNGMLPRISADPKILRAVDNVSLVVNPGETVGLVGESGCGKSTLGRTIVGLVNPTSGEVQLDGVNLAALPKEERRRYQKDVQIIFQNPDSSLNPRKTVGEILARPLIFYGLLGKGTMRRRVGELLETVQLSPSYARRYPHQLSGGEKQRVGIARALAAEPKFIVCDEPISALDVSVRASILNLLDDLKVQFGLSYLFIAHDLAVVKHIADRIAVMYRGQICEIGTVDEVFTPPFHPYTWSLLSAIPIAEYAEKKRQRVILPGSVSGPQTGTVGCIFQDRCPVKIGEICENTPPPDLKESETHAIACHHPVSFLKQLDPMLPMAMPSRDCEQSASSVSSSVRKGD